MRGHSCQPQQWPTYRLCPPGTIISGNLKITFYCRILFLMPSVADPGCLSRTLIFYPSRISDPESNNSTKRGGGEKIVLSYHFFSLKYHKTVNNFSFEQVKNFFSQNATNFSTFYPKICQLVIKNMGLGSGIRGPGSGKPLFRIPHPGSKRHPDPGSAALLMPYLATKM
jgi:hypothetical protein